MTDPASIPAAVGRMTQAIDEAGLAGLINNACLAPAGPLAYLHRIEPCVIATSVGDKLERHTTTRTRAWSLAAHQRYGAAFQARGHPSSLGADAIAHALSGSRPRAGPAVGTNAHRMTILARLRPDRLLDHVLIRLFGLSRRASRHGEAAGRQAPILEAVA